MRPWVLALSMLAILSSLIYLSRASHGPRGAVVSFGGDSLRVVALRDSLARERAEHAHDLDSLRALLERAPDTVWQVARRLVRDTVDTGRVDTLRLVARLVLDDSACHQQRDSLRGDLLVSQERSTMRAEALALCQRAMTGTVAPSSGGTTWTASLVLQGDGEAVRPGLGLDWRPIEHLQVGGEAYARTDGTRPGAGLRIGFSF